MLSKIKEAIDKYDNIIITGHVNPDGDALGSCLAFKFMIEKYKKNKKVKFVLQDKLPKYIYNFEESALIFDTYQDNEADLVITLDCANFDRVALDKNAFKTAKETINIDHHVSNTLHQNINYVKVISSTCELLFEFLPLFNISLDEKIAKFLYLGIINDTGNFRHKNVTEHTFYCAYNLCKCNIDTNFIYNSLFGKSNLKAKIFGLALSKYIYYKDIKFAYFYISKEDILKLNATNHDLDGISELLLSIEDVDVALFLKEQDNNLIKGSFRSKNVDVNKIASIFNGGGHKLAAGFSTDLKADQIVKEVISRLEE